MAWEKNGTPDTAVSAVAELTISDLTITTFNTFFTHMIRVTSFAQPGLQLGSGAIDEGTNYAARFSYSGTTDITNPSIPYCLFQADPADPSWDQFTIQYVINVATEEKLVISFNVGANNAGAANAPFRQEMVGKWVNITNQFDACRNDNVGSSSSYDTNSNLSAIGTT